MTSRNFWLSKGANYNPKALHSGGEWLGYYIPTNSFFILWKFVSFSPCGECDWLSKSDFESSREKDPLRAGLFLWKWRTIITNSFMSVSFDRCIISDFLKMQKNIFGRYSWVRDCKSRRMVKNQVCKKCPFW